MQCLGSGVSYGLKSMENSLVSSAKGTEASVLEELIRLDDVTIILLVEEVIPVVSIWVEDD